jgi:hypothetical protein
MPNLDEFLNKENKNSKPYDLEQVHGVRPCSKCDENVSGALWDPVEFVMFWTCSNGHENKFQVG